MNCHIIFYMARKTGLCEKALSNALTTVGLNPASVFFSANPTQLGESLINSLDQCNLVFTVGGLYSPDKLGISKVLSNALAKKPPQEIKKLKNNLSDYDGYIIRQDCQLIVVLPDEPEEITEFFKGPLKDFLAQFISSQS